MNTKIVNLYAGPGTGKSTTMAALFAECKYQGHNTEMIPEFAKDAAWEGRGDKFFKAQSYIFGCQSFRVDSIIEDVSFAITDSPVLQALCYIPDDYTKPALRLLARQHHDSHESIDIFLRRKKAYNPKGRLQTEDKARELDIKIRDMLLDQGIPFYELDCTRDTPIQIMQLMTDKGWIERPWTEITDGMRYKWISNNYDAFRKIQAEYPLGGFEIEAEIDKAIKIAV